MPFHDMQGKPNPGSDEAIKQGCICPVMDNAHGKGDAIFGMTDPNTGAPRFWIDTNCPLHGIKKEEEP